MMSEKKGARQSLSVSKPSQDQLSSLLECYQNGQFDDAEKLAVSITKEFPKHQFGWEVLGTVLKRTGRAIDSLTALQTLTKLAPQSAEAHYNLGSTLEELGRLGEAEASYMQAIALKPDLAEAHGNLGVTFHKQGRLDQAVSRYKQAIALKPEYAEGHYNLGVILQELGRLDEAVDSYKQAIAMKRDFAEAYYNLGITLQKLERLDAAVDNYEQAAALKPTYTEAHYNLGITLQELGRLDEAADCYTKTIALKPNYAEALTNLGGTLQKLGRLDEALASYNQAVALQPDLAEAHNNLGVTLKELGRLEEAEASYTQAILLRPDYAEAYNNLGVTFQELGRSKEALDGYRQAIALKPDYAEAHRHLTSLKEFDAQDEQYLQMVEIYLDENISEEQRCHINFGLAKACEDLQDFEKAFAHYDKANVLRKKLLNYNINQDVELFKRLKSSYPKIIKTSLEREKATNSLTPIFIVGLPRSGTTLVEQIISSHSKVTGAGELNFAKQFGASIATGCTEVNTQSLLGFRENYLNGLRNVSAGKLIVTDKMPQNFRYIGLLAAAFPEAKIVHVRRNPAAVCWANYKQYFASKSIGYCYAIDDVISYHRLYENLMDFWTITLSKRIYNLDYEQLTINQDSETRLLIKYLGLDWDEKCLSPENNIRSVATASNLQVRQKVYRGSSEQWRKYRPFLNGVFDQLLSQ